MEITQNTQIYLILNRLPQESKDILNARIEELNHFYIGPDSVLLCSKDDEETVLKFLTLNILDHIDKVTLLNLHSSIFGLGPMVVFPYERKTVFDK